MANTKRRSEYVDRNGNMFMPMNVEGGVWNEHFITTPKLLVMAGMILTLFAICASLSSQDAKISQYIIWVGIWAICDFYIMRFFVFEEKFYYRMYKELQAHEISTPALFWDIASIKDTDDGAIMTYSDAKIAVMVRVERDTITGKTRDFKEVHYDAISDFYREVATNRYSFVQMNIMEQAGKDPRLLELSKIITKSDNSNICKLMELQVGHIKNITHTALYETDYFLFFTQDLSKIDCIIQEVSECIFKLLDGAYIGYQVLTSKEIVDVVKELYGVNYFNSTEASLMMFDKTTANSIVPFTLSGILWDDEELQELEQKEISKIRSLTSEVIRGTLDSKKLSLKEAVYRKNTKNKIGIDFDKIGDVTQVKKKKQVRNIRGQGIRPNQQQVKTSSTTVNNQASGMASGMVSSTTVNNQASGMVSDVENWNNGKQDWSNEDWNKEQQGMNSMQETEQDITFDEDEYLDF